MKKFVYSFIFALLLSSGLYAQDARQRTMETIVQDVMAAMPADDFEDFCTQMKDLAESAPESVVYLAGRMKPSDSGKNSIVEYAINGVVVYASDPANEAVRENVRKGLEQAVSKTWDKYNRQFLEEQLRFLQTYEGNFEAYVSQTYPMEKFKELDRSSESRERCQALWLCVESLGEKSEKEILSALRESDRSVRTTALYAYEPYAGDEFYSKIAKAYRRLSDQAKADVIYWFGEKGVESQVDLVLSELNSGGEKGSNAIEAAGKLGSEKSAKALLALLGGEYTNAAVDALKYIDYDISGMVNDALAASGNESRRCVALLGLASEKRNVSTVQTVFSYVSSSYPEISSAASAALSGVVSSSDFAQIAELYDSAVRNQDNLEKALFAALKEMSGPDAYVALRNFIASAEHPERFYMAIAGTETDDAVSYLKSRYEEGSESALQALSQMNNIAVAEVLLEASDSDQEYLRRYVDVVRECEKDMEKKFEYYSKALSIVSDSDILNHILKAMGELPTRNAFNTLASYLDNEETSYAAASSLKQIAATKASVLDYYVMKEVLAKASDVFAATGNADDGYSVDEIKKILESARPYDKYELTAEEKRKGYEILFDGTDLSKWVGDKVGYTVVNGCIEVGADYGEGGNLYTSKEYSDFILRFDFCFEKEGVNNGIGIRTPMGVDAAYYGMCEVQILDHDAPIYADLMPYQVHGSVYGIVPAKRIVHKPLGEWSSQEIRVSGDRVTVKVNGEVIVDANVIKACKGNNVAPDGGDVNPYTADGRNHPGLYNKKGHIGFLGHGEGMKYRNVRILDLK